MNNWNLYSFFKLMSDIFLIKLPIYCPSWMPIIIKRIFFGQNSRYIKDEDEILDRVCFIYLNGILSNFKTKIGSNQEIKYNDKIINETDILSIFFNHLKDLLDKSFDNSIYNVILTVPSNFNDNQRKILMSVATNVGFNILRIINEPTAAAFAYGLNTKIDDEKIMVFDIGGGTMDVTILEVDDNFFETIDSIGVNDLGGNDFTNLIYNDCLKEFKEKINYKNEDSILISQSKLVNLTYKCNKAKEKLLWVDSCQIKIEKFYKKDNIYIDLIYNLDNAKFKMISQKILDRIQRKISTFKKKYEISKLILVGGSSKLKIIQDLLEDEFKIKPLVHNQLQHVVSLGACYYGALIQGKLGNDEIILVDNLPLSLGIETAEGSFSIIIPKNTPLPVTRSQKYTIDTPGEEMVTVKVYQGERSIACKNYLIGEFEFNKISKVGQPIIDITFKVDINGLINVTIKDKHSGSNKDVLIRNVDDNIKSNLDAILKEADENKDIDDAEMIKTQLVYKLEIRIETILNNIKNNNLLVKEKKEEMSNELLEELDKLRSNNIANLIKLDKLIDDKYFTLTQAENNFEVEDDNVELNIEETIKKEKLEFLSSKVEFYITKDISEFQRQCLYSVSDFLKQDNINNVDIDEKIEYIKELFKENDKNELLNLCLFLKEEIENFSLEISDDQSKILSEIISKYLKLLDENNDMDYKKEIVNLNKICEDLLKNN